MKIELHSKMSRAETFQALRITLEAAERLARRMTPAKLQRMENCGAALIGVAGEELSRRRPQSRNIAYSGSAICDEGGPPMSGH